MIPTTSGSKNDTNGNGQFGTLVRKRTRRRSNKGFSYEDYTFLDKKDRRMRFNNARDPIYYVFECIENRPVSTLAKEFVKDTIFEITNFVSKVVA